MRLGPDFTVVDDPYGDRLDALEARRPREGFRPYPDPPVPSEARSER